MNQKTYFFVVAIETQHTVNVQFVGNASRKLQLKWADGMVGVMAVFDSKKKAKKYAGRGLDIEEIQILNKGGIDGKRNTNTNNINKFITY